MCEGFKKALKDADEAAGNEPYALDKGDFGGNKITSNRAISDVKALAGDKWFVDDKLAERYENHIKEVVRITGGNRQIYNEVMKDVAYNRDTAFLGFIGGEDDIEGLPDLGDVEDRVADIIARAEALFEGEKPDKIQSATDRLFNR